MYGYTSANFSGRMPCNTIADAIVGTARSMTERAILEVQEKFGMETVYGDTDSVFVDLQLNINHRYMKLYLLFISFYGVKATRPVDWQYDILYRGWL